MDSKAKDVVEDVRSHTTKFSYIHNSGQNKKASKDDNVVSKKQKYTDAIQHETTSKGVQILEILRKPYDKEEHERLMQEITKRKPQHKYRDLRSGGVKFYTSDKMGKSLLDHHLVLKRKIEEAVSANNDVKQLNLLRGFFFWLQNITDDESFIPWNDKECIDVQPEGS
ncbi:hypothetical protein M9H77_11559 [Catharanthus roseus]|uniref:Uncharacterized protein n=1 Tax=Catharanthus roseus TaxID=4058 RepID=A0ACC0BEU8_CATRO|nr:hypothetical protein M9H77_11559 [Catharanthus roseus]